MIGYVFCDLHFKVRTKLGTVKILYSCLQDVKQIVPNKRDSSSIQRARNFFNKSFVILVLFSRSQDSERHFIPAQLSGGFSLYWPNQT